METVVEIMQKYAAIYVRVSTLDQVLNGYGLDAQERALRQWCADNGYEVYELYADKGISGKDIDHRPDMSRLIRDAEARKFSVVVFWSLSRITRSVADLYNLTEKLLSWDVSMVSYTEPIDTTSSMGRALMGIMGVYSQLERELTTERVVAAMAERAAQGKRTTSHVLGYDNEGSDCLVINDKEAEYVRFCFLEYLRRKNLSEVAAAAAAKGYRGKRGKAPCAWSVNVILTRPIYCGYNTFRGKIYKGSHECIIDVDTYNRVQELLIKQGFKNRSNRINAPKKIEEKPKGGE